MSQPVAELLEKTAEVLERDGWCQGSFVSSMGAHCAVGAMRQAAAELRNGHSLSHRTVEARSRLARYLGIGLMEVTMWNDAFSRTGAEVIDTIKLVAKDLRNEAKDARNEDTP